MCALLKSNEMKIPPRFKLNIINSSTSNMMTKRNKYNAPTNKWHVMRASGGAQQHVGKLAKKGRRVTSAHPSPALGGTRHLVADGTMEVGRICGTHHKHFGL